MACDRNGRSVGSEGPIGCLCCLSPDLQFRGGLASCVRTLQRLRGAAAAEGALQRPRGKLRRPRGKLVPPKPLTWILPVPFRTGSHYSQHRLLRGVTVDSGESFKQILKVSKVEVPSGFVFDYRLSLRAGVNF